MRLSSVHAARVVWFLDMDELNPRGGRLFPDLVDALVKAFKFTEFPQSAAQMDPAGKNGIRFGNGKFRVDKDRVVAWDLEIHTGAIAVETRDSTATSEHILDEVNNWGVLEFGLNFTPTMIRKKLYVSQLVVYPEGDITKGLQKLTEFSDLLSATKILGEVKKRELASLFFKSEGADRWAFSFERRADAPFNENKYYSASDVSTDVHLSLLTRFEGLLSS